MAFPAQQELMTLFMTGTAQQTCIAIMQYQTVAKNTCWNVGTDMSQLPKRHVLKFLVIKKTNTNKDTNKAFQESVWKNP